QTLSGHTNSVVSLAFSPNSRLLASGSWDNSIKIWDVSAGRDVKDLIGHTNIVNSVCFVSNGLVISGSGDDTVKMWDVISGRDLRTLTGHTNSVNSVSCSN